MGNQPVLARPIIVRADRHDALEGNALESLQRLLDLARGIATHPDQDRNAAAHDGCSALDHRVDLRFVEGRGLSGSAEQEQTVGASLDVMLDQAVIALEIDGAILERRDQRHPEAGNAGCHGVTLCPVLK